MNIFTSSNQTNGMEVAIIGMSGRFPGAKNVEEFWHNLCHGLETVSFFSDEDLRALGVPDFVLDGPNYVKAEGVLEGIALFDAAFFGFNPREAEIMDPQHRIFLECASEALENAGYDAAVYSGTIGLYAGVGVNRYFDILRSNRELMETVGDLQAIIGNDKDHLATRVSYKLDLRGPSVTVQTACSTSLVAVHQACQSLLGGECDIALAGGISLNVSSEVGYFYQQGGITSPDGHCRAFDAKAQGTVFGSGVGIVVLKRLSEALADGDCIHAVIKGSAINNDGSVKIGYTAPSVEGQASVIRAALIMAEVKPEMITYVETHGTGTVLGDPIEIAALTQAFGIDTQAKAFCAIGSVKTNIGHLDVASGIAGLIKTTLALKHKMLPASLHFEKPNPKIDFLNSPFYVNACLREWKKDENPRRAGVSSFGIGGTNAHIVLEEAPLSEPSKASRPWHLLALSARTSSALEAMTTNLREYFRQHPDPNMDDVAYTLHLGRHPFAYRRIAICQNLSDALHTLEAADPSRVFTAFQDAVKRPVIFMFPGQGTQYVNMARELYLGESIFREQVDLCAKLLTPHLGLSLLSVLYPKENTVDEAKKQLNQTWLTQPALFVIEYALAKQLMAWGIHPQAMIGHSIGEYVAACLAGVFSLKDALALVAIRGRLMQHLPTGAMVAVYLSEQDVHAMLDENLSLAAVNAPSQCVVSGPPEIIESWTQQLTIEGVEYHRLETSHAFHSKMVEPIMDVFLEQLKKVERYPPSMRYISNITGAWITETEAMDPEYWVKHLRQTVRFADGIQRVRKELDGTLLEVGPGHTLSALAKQQTSDRHSLNAVPSMRQHYDNRSDIMVLLLALGKLWLAGVQVNWSAFYANAQRRRLPLPTYPFERQRYWPEAPKQLPDPQGPQPTLSRKQEIADWFYIPSWKRSMPPKSFRAGDYADRNLCWLIFADSAGLGNRLAQNLEEEGQVVFLVNADKRFEKLGDRTYAIRPTYSNDYDALLKDIYDSGGVPQVIVHLWTITENRTNQSEIAFFDKMQELGYYSLLYLTQSLEKVGIINTLQIEEAIQLEIVTNNLHEVAYEEEVYPEKATVLGLCKVIQQEYRGITCHCIDIGVRQLGTEQYPKLLGQLMAEIVADSSDLVIAYRGTQRWVQTFEVTRLDHKLEQARQLRRGGVYLITGGLGRVALLLARHLARTLGAKLVLLSHSSFPVRDSWEQWLFTHDIQDDTSRKIRELQAMEGYGAEVLVVSADVADQEQMQRVINQVYERFGNVNGVLHTAANIKRSTIYSQIKDSSRKISEHQFRPKVHGLYVLENLFRGRELDFCLLFSSNAATLGGLGLAAYAAANLFMDIFAIDRSKKNDVPWISTSWDGWLFEEANPEDGLPHTSIDQYALSPEESVEAFERIVTKATVGHLIVSSGDLYARLNLWIQRASVRDSEYTDDNLLLMRPNLTTQYMAPTNEVEQKIADIWQRLLGIKQVGVHDNFFELGGNSLMITQLIAQLNQTFQIKVPLHSLNTVSTLAQLAQLVEGLRPPAKYQVHQEGSTLPPALIQLQLSSSQRHPFFLIHAVGGGVYIYRDLVQYLGRDQTVYGLQAQGLNGERSPMTRIEDMASSYIKEVRTLQPQGPYFLGGASFGGIVAFEMAQQLVMLGLRVSLLALMDTPGPGQMPKQFEDDAAILAYMSGGEERIPLPVGQLRPLGSEEQLLRFLEYTGITNVKEVLPQARYLLQVWKANIEAMCQYVPQSYMGRIVFFRANEWDGVNALHPELAWRDIAAKGIEIYTVPGDHNSMLASPHVQALADLLRRCLRDADDL